MGRHQANKLGNKDQIMTNNDIAHHNQGHHPNTQTSRAHLYGYVRRWSGVFWILLFEIISKKVAAARHLQKRSKF
jgi:hypothetical protein